MNQPLLATGKFPLHAGHLSSFKIDCDALSYKDIKAAAAMFLPVLPPFGYTFGVPRGGIRFANALLPYVNKESATILIVDDVLTTGKSMVDHVAKLRASGQIQEATPLVGVTLFSRMGVPSPEQVPFPVLSLFYLYPTLHELSVVHNHD